MSDVKVRIFIEAPYTQALGAFQRRLGLADESAEGTCDLTLIVPAGAHEIARVVHAATRRLPGEANYLSHFAISWPAGRTSGGVPTPAFSGVLALGAGENYQECVLELSGSYAPPGGPAGGVFDEVIGRRIAHTTLSMLLDDVGRELRTDHERIESEKKVERTRP
jgi:hypothetical protein